jgi:hypothetical protein
MGAVPPTVTFTQLHVECQQKYRKSEVSERCWKPTTELQRQKGEASWFETAKLTFESVRI